jgi:hypothetical protein
MLHQEANDIPRLDDLKFHLTFFGVGGICTFMNIKDLQLF